MLLLVVWWCVWSAPLPLAQSLILLAPFSMLSALSHFLHSYSSLYVSSLYMFGCRSLNQPLVHSLGCASIHTFVTLLKELLDNISELRLLDLIPYSCNLNSCQLPTGGKKLVLGFLSLVTRKFTHPWKSTRKPQVGRSTEGRVDRFRQWI
jgi:hypothetical protein